MKRLLYIMFLLSLGLNAQNMYNVSSFLENELVGTARYVGMGGAMSALGADLSTMGTNPAGMAMYRSSDFAFTAGVDVKSNKAVYEGNMLNTTKANAYVGNAAFVFSMERGGDYLEYLNIGIGYRRKNNLAGAFEMCGASNGYSQQYVIDALYRNHPFEDFNAPKAWMYENLSYSWLPLLAAEAPLVDEQGNYFLTYPDTALIWRPDELAFYEETRGGVNVVDFNLSANISDRVYLGATVSASIVDYNRYTEYREADMIDDIYILENNKYIKGSGFDVKLGAIFRPFKYSPFKVGVSVHTPTWYSLNEYSSATITGPYGKYCSTTDYDLYNDLLKVRSSLRTPWRFNASMAYTFGSYVALNAEYEYTDYSLTKFRGRGAVEKSQNEEFECNMKEQHTVRVGAEINADGFAVRVGYNYITAPFANDAYKYMYNASVAETSTEYMNRFDKNVVTMGFGWHDTIFYCDFAYKLELQKAEFYPFYDFDFVNPAATVDQMNHSVVATVGMRF